MISFDFDYFKPDTLDEAISCYHQLDADQKHPLYYAGGTEILSMARAESIHFGAVIDLKGIPECRYLGADNHRSVLGSCVTLTQIAESNPFPLLSETVSRIADHSIQDKITLGGNLAGTIQYREAALPLMITNSAVRLMTQNGLKEVSFSGIFDGRLKIQKGDFLVQILIDEIYLTLPYVHVKKTKFEKIDYPLITLCGIKNKQRIGAAVSSVANAPLLLPSEPLNDQNLTAEQRVNETINQIRPAIQSDLSGSKEYREFVLKNELLQMFENFNEG